MAQSIVEGGKAPVKFSEVVARHNAMLAAQEPAKNEHKNKKNKAKKEGANDEEADKNYHFDRWKWYWQQHLDPNGYLVSPLKTWNEWEKYNHIRAGAKTTGASSALWSFVGPDSSGDYSNGSPGSGVGRINCVAFHPTDPNTYWIGSPGGGGWKTTNNGLTWTCMTDQLPLLSISEILYNPLNPNTMYICTGDRDGDDYYSIGVLKSYDGGNTWNTTGLTWDISTVNLANSMVINPSDTNTLILGTSLGIYSSHDGGNTWVLSPSSATGFDYKQVLYHPTDTNIVYATSHYNDSTSASAQIFRSADGGYTWTQVTTFTDAYRISLAVSPAAINIVVASVAEATGSNQYGLNGVWHSTDTGHTFTEIFTGGCTGHNNLLSFNADGTGCGGQGFYDLPIAMSPTNANDVYLGGVNAWRSTNGGTSWTIMNQWSEDLGGVVTIHADKHFMGFQPTVPGRFFETNDGGVYWSDNPTSTTTWNDVTNGLGITEFYRVAVSGAANYIIGGAQDVGTKLIEGPSQDLLGGDGFECWIDPVDSNIAYASLYYGQIYFLDSVGGSEISTNIPGMPQGGWVTPYIIPPSCTNCLLAGYQDVYSTTDYGTTWSDISGPLTGGDLLRVAASYTDHNTVYASEDGSANIYYTSTFGTSGWTTLPPPPGTGDMVSDIKVDLHTPTKLWVTFSGYGGPEVMSYSPSAGWVSYNTGLPDVPVDCIQIDTSNGVKYAGTDIGVFYRTDTMASWQPFQTGMPVVRVNDLQINYATGQIWAATYGRSLWQSPKQVYTPADTTTSSTAVTTPASVEAFNVAPNPSHGSFTITLNSKTVTAKNVNVHITNSAGSTVWDELVPVNGNTSQVNTRHLAAGEYIIEVNNGEHNIGRKKVVIY
jgi:photosystem II stability/assembly factor-like uncharacterized protein